MQRGKKLCNAISLEINYNETQFSNGSFQSLLRSYEVRHIAIATGDYNCQVTVEWFNRTLEAFIGRYHESRETNRCIDDSDALVFNYNNTFHKSIQDTRENKYQVNPSGGTIKTKHLKENIKIDAYIQERRCFFLRQWRRAASSSLCICVINTHLSEVASQNRPIFAFWYFDIFSCWDREYPQWVSPKNTISSSEQIYFSILLYENASCRYHKFVSASLSTYSKIPGRQIYMNSRCTCNMTGILSSCCNGK